MAQELGHLNVYTHPVDHIAHKYKMGRVFSHGGTENPPVFSVKSPCTLWFIQKNIFKLYAV